MPQGVYKRTDKHYAIMRSPERLRKISAASKRLWKTKKHRKHMKQVMTGRKITWADKISTTISAMYKNDSSYLANRRAACKSPKFLKRMAELRAQNNAICVHPNKAELNLESILKQFFSGQFLLNHRYGRVIAGKAPDFIGTKKKLLVEMFGTYWHGEEKTGRNKHEEERLRVRIFSGAGYRTVIIWEDELDDTFAIVSKVAAKLASSKPYLRKIDG